MCEWTENNNNIYLGDALKITMATLNEDHPEPTLVSKVVTDTVS